ncbi:hypothetical protein DFH07DRAFT_769305 [Mycena maculata]|uniref:Uncharacterized protein n=1 Tax=Mycena maculata TaxID=230809 RepID=A0AAD7JMI0_9AGAR|nr:hypothetical protein DFH07DRAFT_769305 [Mycena maculata]
MSREEAVTRCTRHCQQAMEGADRCQNRKNKLGQAKQWACPPSCDVTHGYTHGGHAHDSTTGASKQRQSWTMQRNRTELIMVTILTCAWCRQLIYFARSRVSSCPSSVSRRLHPSEAARYPMLLPYAPPRDLRAVLRLQLLVAHTATSPRTFLPQTRGRDALRALTLCARRRAGAPGLSPSGVAVVIAFSPTACPGADRLLAPLVTRGADASRRRTAAATPHVALRHFEFVDTPARHQRPSLDQEGRHVETDTGFSGSDTPGASFAGKEHLLTLDVTGSRKSGGRSAGA